MSQTFSFDVYYDYGCPYVHRAAAWLDLVRERLGEELQVRWQFFPLEQVNSTEGDDWELWSQPDTYRSRGLWAFRGALAARRQGEDAFGRYHLATLQARHEDGREIAKRETIAAIAAEVGLVADAFARDLDDRSLLPAIGEEYRLGRNGHGVFGTPTFVFPNGEAAYLKLSAIPPAADALDVFAEFVHTVRDRTYVEEIKRAKPRVD